MKNSVVYATKTGHSKKIAKAVAEALGISETEAASGADIGEAEILFIIGGIYAGESSPSLLEYVRGLEPEKIHKAALITSCTSGKTGQDAVRKCLEDKGIDVIGEYICYGSFLVFKLGHPNKEEIQKAVLFAKELAG